MIDRRTLLTTAAAACFAPALPVASATSTKLVPWPPEIVELNRVTMSIARRVGAESAAAFFRDEAMDELANYHEQIADIEGERLAAMSLEYPASKLAFSRYQEDGYVTPCPDWKPPFVSEDEPSAFNEPCPF